MIEIVEIPAAAAAPDPRAVLALQGVPAEVALGLPGAGPEGAPDERLRMLLAEACQELERCAVPRGAFASISAREFASVYAGEGRNEPQTPLAAIFPRAEALALFVVTLGEEVSRRIAELFQATDFALGSLLDSAASESTERAADFVEHRFLESLPASASAAAPSPPAALRYSPGYCGWHVSGQRALLARLEPEHLGIRLRESFLMEPLKSLSGVIVVGPAEIHDFDASFPFCATCRTRSCRERIRRLARRSDDESRGGAREIHR
jgi:hypothetical protein